MKKTLAKKITVPMAVIILIAALLVSWTLSWVQVRREKMDAQNDLESARANLMDILALTQDELVSKMTAEMNVLQSQARRLGVGSQGLEVRAGTGTVPDIRFGKVSQPRLMELVEPVSMTAEGTFSIYSQRGSDLVRLASSAFLPDGTQAIGSVLDPASPAYLALSKGREYWGPTELFGSRHYTYYEPIRDAAGGMIGAFGIEVPLARLCRIYQSIHRVKILDHGFVAMVDQDGRALFSGRTLSPEGVQRVFQGDRTNGEAWSVQRQVFAPWAATVLAAYPEKDLEKAVWLIRGGAMGVALLLVGALTLSYDYVLRKNLLRPLGEVLGILDGISRSERYGTRFKPEEDGEISALTQSLNGMLDQIQARDRKLLEYQEHLEDLVAQRLDQLRETQQLLASTLDALPAAIAILDGDGTILVANRQWDLLTGSANLLIARAGAGTAYLPICRALQAQAGEIGTVAAQVAGVIQGDRGSASLDYGVEVDRQHQWFTILATRFGTAEKPRIVVMQLDVTEKRLMEIQLRHAQKLESIGQLAAGIAHEINTPTQYIGDNTVFLRGAFQDLWNLVKPIHGLLMASTNGVCPPGRVLDAKATLEQVDLDFFEEEIPKAIQESLEGIRRVSSIVSAMKDFSHPGESSKTPTDLNRAIEATTLVCRGEWKYLAELELDLAPDLPLVPCLPDEFNQVILNLIINAAHAIGQAGKDGKGLIRIATRSAGDHAQITITDTGVGIPEAIQSRVFDPFFTTKPVGKGTGQGLAIAHAVIVEQHGGSIALESEMGQGTTFTICLPFDHAAEARPAPGAPAQECS